MEDLTTDGLAAADLTLALRQLADRCPPPQDPLGKVDQFTGRPTHRTGHLTGAVALISAAAVIAVIAGSTLAVRHHDPVVPLGRIQQTQPDTAYDAWAAQGPLAADPRVPALVTRAWDVVGGPHDGLRILYAGAPEEAPETFGKAIVVVALARARDGARHIGWFTTGADGQLHDGELTLRADSTVADQPSAQDISAIIPGRVFPQATTPTPNSSQISVPPRITRPTSAPTSSPMPSRAASQHVWTVIALAAPGYTLTINPSWNPYSSSRPPFLRPQFNGAMMISEIYEPHAKIVVGSVKNHRQVAFHSIG